MVFTWLRRRNYGTALERAGIQKGTPSHDIALDFALRFPKEIESEIFLFDDLSYQKPHEYKQELEAMWDYYQSGKSPLVTDFSRLGLPFKPLEQLIKIYGGGDRAGNILRALSGVEVEQDADAAVIHDIQSRIGGPEIEKYRIPEAIFRVSRSPDEYASNYLFSLLLFTELGINHPGPCYEHVAGLTRRHSDVSKYRRRLEELVKSTKESGLAEVNKNIGIKNVLLYGLPSVAFLTESDREIEAINRIKDFANQESGSLDSLLPYLLGSITVCSKTVEGMQECFDSFIETREQMRQPGKSVPHFTFLRYLKNIIGSVEDFRNVLEIGKDAHKRLCTSDYKIYEQDYIMKSFSSSVRYRDISEFSGTIDQIVENLLQFPYSIREGGLADAVVSEIGLLSSTPTELVDNSRLYGKLTNSMKSAPYHGNDPYLDLVREVNKQKDATEDECVEALTKFYEKIKYSGCSMFSTYGDFGPKRIWKEFLRMDMLPKILAASRVGDFDIHLDVSTHTESGDCDYIGSWHATYLDSVSIDVSPK